MRREIWIFGILLLWGLSGFAQSPEDRVGRVEEKLAALAAQMERLQATLQSFGGGSEAQGVQIQQFQQKSDTKYRDLEMRLGAMEGEVKLLRQEVELAIAKVNPALDKERKEFQANLNLITQADYAKAIAGFQQFIKKYPKSRNIPEALFWIGEARYASGNYQQAIKDYQKFVVGYPKSERAPTAILKQGEGFLQLQLKEEAKTFWKKLIQEYPKSPEALQAKSKMEALIETPPAAVIETKPPKETGDF